MCTDMSAQYAHLKCPECGFKIQAQKIYSDIEWPDAQTMLCPECKVATSMMLWNTVIVLPDGRVIGG